MPGGSAKGEGDGKGAYQVYHGSTAASRPIQAGCRGQVER